MLEMCKAEILQLVERHFDELKEQFVKVMQAAGMHTPDRQAEEFLLGKIEEYNLLIAELQASIYRFSEVDERHIQEDMNLALQAVERKEQESHRLGPRDSEYPRLQLNETALQELGDSLSQLIGFQPSKEIARKMLKIDTKMHYRDNPNPPLAAFLETSSLMLMFEVREKKALKVSFRDFTCPIKAKVATTPLGKVVVVGGEKLLTDGSVRYSREINVLDTKFCMMKVAALMKEGRIHHSLVALQEGTSGRETIYILGGRNLKRLSSLERFETGVNTVSLLRPYHCALGGQTGVHLAGRLFYFGGLLEDEPNRHILIYDIAKDQWSSAMPLNSLNYVPALDPIVLPLNKENVLILGGIRKEGSVLQPYPLCYVQHYNIRCNYIPYTFSERVSSGIASLGHGCELSDGVFHLLVARKNDNLGFGPAPP